MKDAQPGTHFYRACLTVVAAIAAASCVGGSKPAGDDPAIAEPAHASGVGALADCTDVVLEDRKELYDAGVLPMPSRPSISEMTRAEIIRASTAWAKANCYIPCSFEMCAAILEDTDGRIGVYIRPLAPEEGTLYPEAGVWFDPETLELVETVRYHTGCVEWTGECRPQDS